MADSDTGVVFDVQRFSVDDGPGIRTTVFFKGCPLRCLWCQNPESFRREPEILFYPDRCRGDLACLPACPHGALGEGEPRIRRELCDGCGRCVGACPYGALQLAGRVVTATEIGSEAMRDEPFHRASGGGVTLSGGEPTLQLPFMASVARILCERGVDLGLQTCGAFAWDSFAPLVPLFRFIHFDLKVVDREEHRRLTSVDNAVILANARRLRDAGAPLELRMPVVPGHNDSPANLRAVGALVRELGITSIRLLRYHDMGESKRARLGLGGDSLGIGGDQAMASIGEAARLLRAQGVEVAL